MSEQSESNGHKTLSESNGFTIVELLVVIVVIGILAAIIIVTYTGITSRAAKATLQSDLKNASTQIGMDNVNNGSYPASEAAANSGKGLSKSPGTVFSYTMTDGEFCLSATSTNSGNTAFHISSTNGSTEEGLCPLVWKKVALGAYHTCAIVSDDQAYCWGVNWDGQLGNNSNAQGNVPIAVDNTGELSGKTIKSIATGAYHVCVIASDDKAYCWGQGVYGALGNDSINESDVPVSITTTGALSGKTILAIAAGYYHTCVIASDNQAYCWGRNLYGELGNNLNTQSNVPVAVDKSGVLNGKTIKSISLGTGHTCVIASDNQAYCWGYNLYGQLGNNLTFDSWVPVAVDITGVFSDKIISSIAVGDSHTCAIASDNLAYCWGNNGSGQLGLGLSDWDAHPVPLVVTTVGALTGKTIKSITIAGYFSCVIASDNLAYCWGYNNLGQLGIDSADWDPHPAPLAVITTGVLSGKTIKFIASGWEHTCAIDYDNLAYCWGNNDSGQLGIDSADWDPHPAPLAVITPES